MADILSKVQREAVQLSRLSVATCKRVVVSNTTTHQYSVKKYKTFLSTNYHLHSLRHFFVDIADQHFDG